LTFPRAIAVAAAMLLVIGCGDDKPSDRPAGNERAAVDLEIVVADRSATRIEASLRCDGDRASARGFAGASARNLCRTAVDLAPFLARAPDPQRVCTQIYGGPQTAHVAGTIHGRHIDRRFARTDGCEISDWDRAKVLLPK
jgi:hypothetical protein